VGWGETMTSQSIAGTKTQSKKSSEYSKEAEAAELKGWVVRWGVSGVSRGVVEVGVYWAAGRGGGGGGAWGGGGRKGKNVGWAVETKRDSGWRFW